MVAAPQKAHDPESGLVARVVYSVSDTSDLRSDKNLLGVLTKWLQEDHQ